MINQNFTGGQLTTVLILILLVPRYLCVLLVSMWSVYSSLNFCSELTTLPLLDHLFLILSVCLHFAPLPIWECLLQLRKPINISTIYASSSQLLAQPSYKVLRDRNRDLEHELVVQRYVSIYICAYMLLILMHKAPNVLLNNLPCHYLHSSHL